MCHRKRAAWLLRQRLWQKLRLRLRLALWPQLWRFGEMHPGSVAADVQEPLRSIWAAWLAQLGQSEAVGWPGLYLMGPAHSGRHRLARLLVGQMLRACGHVAWLGPEPPWNLASGLSQNKDGQAPGQLLFGRVAEARQAAQMAQTLLRSCGPQLVVWVLPQRQPPSDVAAIYSSLCCCAQMHGARLLVLAPASPVHLVQPGPAWLLRQWP